MSLQINGTNGITYPNGSVGSTAGNINTGTAYTFTGTETFKDFTGIPSWAKRITVMLNGVSTNGSSLVQIRLGTSGGVVSTGYLGSSANISGSVAGSSTSSMGMNTDNIGLAAMARNGIATITNLGSNTWCFSSIMADSTTALLGYSGSSITLSGTLDRIRITTINGTDTFDAGSINIMWEG